MNRTSFSYVMLAVGLMLLVASDKNTSAENKHETHTMSFNTEQEMKIFVNKDGESDAQVKLVIDGKTYDFSMPEISDGEEKTITTADGKEITIKSVSGDNKISIDGKEMYLPSFGKQKIAAEGLSAMIGRTHQMKVSDAISISGSGLSDDVKNAIVDAVKGVLTSYDVNKKVAFNDNNFAFHIIEEDSDNENMAKYQFKIKSGVSNDDEQVMIIHREIEVTDDKKGN